MYSERIICDLPVDPQAVCTHTEGDLTVFAGSYSRLSNLHPIQIEVENRTWHSVEHFYQYKKAVAAGNKEAEQAIIVSTEPE